MISHADIRRLTEEVSEPAVSFYFPVHATLPDRRKNAIRFRNLTREAEDRLRERGADPAKVLGATEKLFEPEPPVEARGTKGLAVFTAGGEPTVLALPGRPVEQVEVGRGFDILPLLPFVEAQGSFFVITLDRESPTLLKGNRLGLETVARDVMERSLDAIRGTTQFPAALGYHSTRAGGPAGTSNYRHAHGESADDYEQIELDQFAHGIARAAEDRLKSESGPLVPVGEPNLLGMFRTHCRYAGLTETAVAKSPAGLDDEELFRATLEVADDALSEPVRNALGRASEGHHRADGTVSVLPAEIADAAEQGRVGTLLLARNAAGSSLRMAEADGSPAENAKTRREQCDRIVRATLEHGGEIVPVGPNDLPDNAALAALFRF